MLTTDDMNTIQKEAMASIEPSIKTKEALEFRAAIEKELQEKSGSMIIPSEMPDLDS